MLVCGIKIHAFKAWIWFSTLEQRRLRGNYWWNAFLGSWNSLHGWIAENQTKIRLSEHAVVLAADWYTIISMLVSMQLIMPRERLASSKERIHDLIQMRTRMCLFSYLRTGKDIHEHKEDTIENEPIPFNSFAAPILDELTTIEPLPWPSSF